MASSNRNSNDRDRERQTTQDSSKSQQNGDSKKKELTADDNILASVLEEVLKVTNADAESANEPSDGSELEVFQQVARDFKSASIEDATAALVKAVYQHYYPNVEKKLGSTSQISAEVSSVMMESPATRTRIHAFWERLVESVS